jgi:hypothetical protein
MSDTDPDATIDRTVVLRYDAGTNRWRDAGILET